MQKIKSKWKAQKRKEGLAASRAQLEQLVDAHEEGDDADEDEEHSNASHASDTGGPKEDEESEEESGDETSEDETPSHPQRTTSSSKEKLHNSGPSPKAGKVDERPSLRELQRKAYSRSSLHTHKSNPLGRHKGAADSRGHGRGRGAPRGRGGRGGRGQPDMGLRMKAMLEKIRQDYT